MSKRLSTEEIKQQYESNSKTLEKFRERLEESIYDELERNQIKLGFPLKSRVKTLESLLRKIDLGHVNVRKSILEVQDLVGLRIVLRLKRDAQKIIDCLNSSFDVRKIYRPHEALEDNQFGYSSVHMVAKIPKSWLEIPMFKMFDGIQAEIQIRTLAQHTWAEASHIIEYKSFDELPKNIKRSISRISALLETVDLEFERLMDERNEFEKSLEEESLTEKNLEEILDNNIPKVYKSGTENYRSALQALQKAGIRSKGKLLEIIRTNAEKALEKDSKIVEKIIEDGKANESIDYNGEIYSTARYEQIIENKTFFNQLSLLAEVVKASKKLDN